MYWLRTELLFKFAIRKKISNQKICSFLNQLTDTWSVGRTEIKFLEFVGDCKTDSSLTTKGKNNNNNNKQTNTSRLKSCK